MNMHHPPHLYREFFLSLLAYIIALQKVFSEKYRKSSVIK